ncbi:MAG: LCP family protein [Aeriscardovia sp.]|nr:LCP family protein [Aeriscardovia sp.]MBO5633519.1 LCP family protein [Aeriscardovia sp.]
MHKRHQNTASQHSSAQQPIRVSPSQQPLHARLFTTRNPFKTGIGILITVVLVFIITFAGAMVVDFNNILHSHSVSMIGETDKDAYVNPDPGKAINIAIFGQDTRNGSQNQAIAHDTMSDEHESDTIMIAQISANRKYINLVSVPRDSVVSVPSCTADNGAIIPAQNDVMINSLFETGYNIGGDVASAASCATQDLEYLTGIKITQFIVVDFAGLDSIINAIGGVDLCIPEHIQDAYTSLSLPKGWDHLNGLQATEYSRVRHGIGVGDGSDIMREARQQYLVKMILREIKTKKILTNSSDLYQLARTTLQWLTISKGLASLSTLTGLAYALRELNTSDIYARTTPITTDPTNNNRVIWDQPYANELWAKIKNDQPIIEQSSSTSSTHSQTSGTTTSSSATQSSSTTSSTTNSSQSTTTQNSSTSSTTSTTTTNLSKGTYNPHTGLVTMPSGELIDPKNGGIVNPETGVITDPNTGYQMGIASEYLNYVVCGISEEK